jgi:hypothetical protein
MNPIELKMISTYMEVNGLELIGLAMLPDELKNNAFYSSPNLTVSLSNGEIVSTIDIDTAKSFNELNYIETNFKTLMTFEKENYKIIKLF